MTNGYSDCGWLSSQQENDGFPTECIRIRVASSVPKPFDKQARAIADKRPADADQDRHR
jgi:hypothetical protein